jgi:hypothetical protein
MKMSRLGKSLAGLTAACLMGLAAWAQQKTAPTDVGTLDKETAGLGGRRLPVSARKSPGSWGSPLRPSLGCLFLSPCDRHGTSPEMSLVPTLPPGS